ncbi:right-handed parallel beta-helix repeat-containing protein [bacterium]|nr:right-handed parallel beta-helix repeat-containing protein [candidate division CSSED10-310 bacterium]
MKRVGRCALLLIVLFMCQGFVCAAVIHVPADEPDIRSGINAAVPGDMVLVSDGVYTGDGNKNLDFAGKAITVSSENGSTYCIIDCEMDGRGFHFHCGETEASVLSGFTILNGSTSGDGSGILCEDASPAITDCLVTCCSSILGCGGGMAFDNSDAVVTWCRIIANFADSSGGGVACSWSANPHLTDCIIAGNSCRRLGAGICCDNSEPVLLNCHISNNSTNHQDSENSGGGLHCYNCSPVITDCVFSNNRAAVCGGAISLYYGSSPVITGTMFFNNYASFGGAVSCMDGSSRPILGGAEELGNRFAGNRAAAGADLHRANLYGDPVPAGWNTFAGYFPSDYYITPLEGFDLQNSVSELVPLTQDVYVSPWGNDQHSGLTPEDPFRTIHHACAMIYGTADHPITIHCDTGTYSATRTGETFPVPMLPHVTLEGSDNEWTILDAEAGASVVYAVYDNDAVLRGLTLKNGYSFEGGGVFCQDAAPRIADCIICDNHATNGGGICARRFSSALVTGCVITRNLADAAGGGMICELSSPVISDCIFTGNEAIAVYPWERTGGREPTAMGGALCCGLWSTPVIGNCLFAGNFSSHDGGAMCCFNESNPLITNCTFTDNVAAGDGGAVYSIASPAVLENCILWGNAPEEIDARPELGVSYSDVQGGYSGTGNIDAAPLFAVGPLGWFYLGQTAAGQPQDSPCLDAGSAAAGVVCFQTDGGNLCLSECCTRTDHVSDAGIVDLGYHYHPPVSCSPTPPATPQPTQPPPTGTPELSPSAVPSVIHTPVETATPVITDTPAETPPPTGVPATPTPEPAPPPPIDLGVQLVMPATVFFPGDICWLQAYMQNNTAHFYAEYNLFVILDVGIGVYWCYPSWNQYPPGLDWELYEGLFTGTRSVVILSPFTWPEGCGACDLVCFYGAMTDVEVTQVIGEIGICSFSYRE